MGRHLAVFHFATGGLWVRGELLGDSWWLERHGFPMLVELPSGKEEIGRSRLPALSKAVDDLPEQVVTKG